MCHALRERKKNNLGFCGIFQRFVGFYFSCLVYVALHITVKDFKLVFECVFGCCCCVCVSVCVVLVQDTRTISRNLHIIRGRSTYFVFVRNAFRNRNRHRSSVFSWIFVVSESARQICHRSVPLRVMHIPRILIPTYTIYLVFALRFWPGL